MLILLCRKIAGSKPPKKKTKPSHASMPITLEVEVLPKPSSSAALDPKDVINIDDIPEEPTADSCKDASSSKPPPEEPETASAEITANDAKKNVAKRCYLYAPNAFGFVSGTSKGSPGVASCGNDQLNE
jgi:hypothetical protein